MPQACVCVRVCLCRWCSCQLVKGDSGKGAISTQLAVIASTLFWWAAAHCEMTKCCVRALFLRVALSRAIGRQAQPDGPRGCRHALPSFVLQWVLFPDSVAVPPLLLLLGVCSI